MKEIDLA